MKTMTLAALVLVLSLPLAGAARVVNVRDGDADSLSHAVSQAWSNDTIRVWPGTYEIVPPHWPVVVPMWGAGLIKSADGSEATLLLGDGVTPAFTLTGFTGQFRVEGFTVENIPEFLDVFDLDECCGFLLYRNVFTGCGPLNITYCTGAVRRNVFRDCPGLAIDYFITGAVVETNDIYNNGGGIRGQYFTHIIGNHIHDNAGVAISHGNSGYIVDNIIERNGTGVWLASDGGPWTETITGNVVRENDVGFWFYWPWANILVQYNSIYGNLIYNATGGESRSEWSRAPDMSMNWWGTTDRDSIAATLGYPSITFEPYCESPECAVSPAEGKSWGSIKAMFR